MQSAGGGMFELMATMRAMRRLKPDPVPDAMLARLVEAATWAPSMAPQISNSPSYPAFARRDQP